MARPIFVSYVFEDEEWLRQLRDWALKNQLGNNFEIDAFDEQLPPTPDNEIRSRIKERIRNAACVLVVVGNNTHNHEWIRIEVELANSTNRKVLVAKHPGANGGVPPILINKQIIPFSPVDLNNALLYV